MKVLLAVTIISTVMLTSADFGTLWNNFLDVSKLRLVESEMEALVRAGDQDMADLVAFLKMETRPIASCLRNDTQYKEFYNFLVSNGLPLESIFQWINDELDWGQYNPPYVSDYARDGGLFGLWQDLTSIIPTGDLLAWFLEMWAINPDMIKLMDTVRSGQVEAIRNKLHQCIPYLNYRCHFLNAGINLVSIETQACELFQWNDCEIYNQDMCSQINTTTTVSPPTSTSRPTTTSTTAKLTTTTTMTPKPTTTRSTTPTLTTTSSTSQKPETTTMKTTSPRPTTTTSTK